MGLRLRLNLILSVVFAVTLTVGIGLLLHNVRRAVSDELNASVEHTAKLIALVVSRLPSDVTDTALDTLIADIAAVGSSRHLRIFTDATGDSVPLPETSTTVPRWFYQLVYPEPLNLVRVLDLQASRKRVIVRAHASAEIEEAWRESYPLMLMLILFGFIANGLIYVLVGRSLKSLDNVTNALSDIESGQYLIDVPKVGIADIDAIGERVRQLGEVLGRSNAEARNLAQKSLTIREAERRHLAQALHDELGQSISAIKALAVSVQQRMPNDDDASHTSVVSIIDVSTEMYERVRDMMSLLRPTVLDDLGLRAALENMIDEWNGHHEDTFCRLDIPADFPTLSENIEICMFRIVQEALTNIARHSQAAKAEVALHFDQSQRILTLRIADDGTGFSLEQSPRGLGLVGIKERVAAMGGNMDLKSSADGTTYKIAVPLT